MEAKQNTAMPLTRREFLRAGSRGLLAASALAEAGCVHDEGAAELEARIRACGITLRKRDRAKVRV